MLNEIYMLSESGVCCPVCKHEEIVPLGVRVQGRIGDLEDAACEIDGEGVRVMSDEYRERRIVIRFLCEHGHFFEHLYEFENTRGHVFLTSRRYESRETTGKILF